MKIYDVQTYLEGVLSGDRHIIAKAITLLESNLSSHQELASKLLNALIPHSGNSLRVGISGTPGVGKSTFIEALGLKFIEQNRKVAVLAVDPSSPLTGGSIMGDKTRMIELSANKDSFIRPSPSAGTLGGVARKTREVCIVLEAAGYDRIIIETVGVGQSEVVCSSMVDLFLMLQLPNAGDELQGIKKGILELADLICVNKADGDFKLAAKRTMVDLTNALHLVRHDDLPQIFTVSSLHNIGLDQVLESIEAKYSSLKKSGALEDKRKTQAKSWFEDELNHSLKENILSHSSTRAAYEELIKKIEKGNLVGSIAAKEFMQQIFSKFD